MKKLLIITVGVLILLVLGLSCTSIKKSKIYGYGAGYMVFSPDHTYQLKGFGGGEKGFWQKKGKIVILNSEYDPELIEKVKIVRSLSDSNDSCLIRLLDYLGNTPFIGGIIFLNKTKIDTFWFAKAVKQTELVEKSDEIVNLKVLQRNRRDNIPRSALSKSFPVKLTDTVSVYYNYPVLPGNYHFHKNTKFIIKKNRLDIEDYMDSFFLGESSENHSINIKLKHELNKQCSIDSLYNLEVVDHTLWNEFVKHIPDEYTDFKVVFEGRLVFLYQISSVNLSKDRSDTLGNECYIFLSYNKTVILFKDLTDTKTLFFNIDRLSCQGLISKQEKHLLQEQINAIMTTNKNVIENKRR